MSSPTHEPASAPEPAAKRLTLSQIVEMLLTRGASDRSAVTLARNARGETQIEVKVATGADGDVLTVEDAERRALEVYGRLRAAYPAGEGHDNADVSLTRNAKGETQIDAKVSTSDTGSVRTLEQAEAKASAAYERLRASYPLASGFVGAQPPAPKP